MCVCVIVGNYLGESLQCHVQGYQPPMGQPYHECRREPCDVSHCSLVLALQGGHCTVKHGRDGIVFGAQVLETVETQQGTQ